MRVEKSGTRFFGFEEYAKSIGIEPVSKVTKDNEKLKSQQEKFLAKKKCKACGEPFTLVKGTNCMVCANPSCRGIKFTKTDSETGETKVWYEVSRFELDELGTEIANNIF